jgi:hypothetical protein
MPIVVPSWFKWRQGKAEEAGPGLLKLTAPNLKEWFLGIRRLDRGNWLAFVRERADGPDAVAVELGPVPEYDAWEAAFEVYCKHVII